MKEVLVEGWRGINHSYAMVNQYQLAELAGMSHISLSHRDLPYAHASWNSAQSNPGFPGWYCARFNNVLPPSEKTYDCVYRISWPFARSETPADRVLTFMTAEYGVNPAVYQNVSTYAETFCQGGDKVIVPSNWSRSLLVGAGFPESGIKVVPHGVHPELFCPLSLDQRKLIRVNMGFDDEHFIFLNVGAMLWNKGPDVLLKAFCQVRKRYPHVRLVLKEDRQLYGRGVQEVMNDLSADASVTLDDEVMSSISILSSTLTIEIMRNLYAVSDAYVSPYRAEGFNLPVIEALACGTPVIVTEGGPTDDFCPSGMARKITSTLIQNSMRGIPIDGHHLEPSLDSLISLMEDAVDKPYLRNSNDEPRNEMLKNNAWSVCAEKLAELF